MDARCLSGNLRVRRVVARNHFQVSAYFVIFKSHPMAHEGVDPKCLCQAYNKDPWGPAVWLARATRRTRASPCPQEPYPLRGTLGEGLAPRSRPVLP